MSRIVLQPAFILHQRPYRETSLLIELFTSAHGRLSVVGRGLRGPKARVRALVQPFIPLLVSWYGSNELMTLQSVEAETLSLSLKGKSLLCGLYLNELLIKLLPKHDPHPHLFSFYRETLFKLDHLSCVQEINLENHSYSLEKILRLFEKKLLTELGYGLQLHYDTVHQPIQSEKFYYFDPGHGFKPVASQEKSADFFGGKSLIALRDEVLNDPVCLSDAKRLMRFALKSLIGDKPLLSKKLFRTGDTKCQTQSC